MANNKLERDLTQGSVTAQLVRFAWPFLISNLLQALYGVVDMVVVGMYVGTDGISGVNVSSQVMMILNSVIIGLCMGSTVVVSQCRGSGDEKEVKKAVSTTVGMLLCLGAIMTVVGLLVATPVLNIMNTPIESLDQAKGYLQISISGLLFIAMYNGLTAVQRGLGDSLRPLYFIGIATVINIVLDLVLVGGLGLEARGAAIATVIAQGASFLLAAFYLIKNSQYFSLDLEGIRIHKNKFRLIVKVGIPSAVQQALVMFGFTVVVSWINSYGVVASAAAGIGNRVETFATLPAIAMMSAISSMSGQNFGAGHNDRVLKTLKVGAIINVAMAALALVLLWIGAEFFVRFFSNEPAVIAEAVTYLRIAPLGFFGLFILFSVNGMLVGTGNAVVVMITTFMNVFTRIPLIFITNALGMGLSGIYVSMALSPTLGLIVALCFVFSKKWQVRKQLIDAD